MWSKCSDRFTRCFWSWHVTKVTPASQSCEHILGSQLTLPNLSTQKVGGALEKISRISLQLETTREFFFLLFRYTEYSQTGNRTFFFFFFEMCNCVKLLVSDLHRNLEPSCFYPNKNSNWRTSSLSWEHICTKKQRFQFINLQAFGTRWAY